MDSEILSIDTIKKLKKYELLKNFIINQAKTLDEIIKYIKEDD